ncbi:hypothetical protein GCM10010172_44330 [Paractinoplanes ferrugineus]|uniref:Uncharacterized protein n=1 Tax=Paractinoplanes ferrugineus TaxID=113564 RepID=A0A919MBF0_9ACTN|nr:hypothetical protein [Actinoplanes ferrugineus]GIE13591.1 hypothetical protein Afe05nite_54310 [Actinoplanes ferrugineus]
MQLKKRFLVLHDYGMGGLWWWIHARSEGEIAREFAEVEVIVDPAAWARFPDGELDEVDIDDETMPPGLADLRDERRAHRDRPGFGALVGREAVFLRRPWAEADDTEPQIYYEHLGPDGRRLRQVEVYADGTAIRTGPDDWLFNPPTDLHDPDLPQWEISARDFEEAWRRARAEDADRGDE